MELCFAEVREIPPENPESREFFNPLRDWLVPVFINLPRCAFGHSDALHEPEKDRNQSEEDGMEQQQHLHQGAETLYWLALLITGDADASVDLAAEAMAFQNHNSDLFSGPTPAGARRLLIGGALSTIRRDLAASARCVAKRRWKDPDFAAASGNLAREMTKADLEHVLLAMDILPRCALLLCVFEGLSQSEVAELTDIEPSLIAEAQAIGLCDLTRAMLQSRQAVATYTVGAFAHA
jgi:DNA-directed RNA polymerase specialized sigma24 family protein